MSEATAQKHPRSWRQQWLERIDRPGWKRFAVAMLALALAFVLALYSDIFARQGRVIATGICASAALLLAGYVAITAVPYLARRTRLEWLHVGTDYKVTREGWIFIALIMLLAVAGLNTGNNLLYLILSSMLAGILVSGILSLAVLSGIELEVLLPEHVFAQRPTLARIHLENEKRLIPSFSLTLGGGGAEAERKRPKRGLRQPEGRDKLQVRDKPDTRDTLKHVPTSNPALRNILREALYFPFVPGRKAVARTVELEFPRRGLYREDAFFLSTRFPFGFLEKKLRLPVSRDLWVYPSLQPTEEFYETLPMISGELEAYQKGRGHDLYSIRDMVASDGARHVDWKASARTRSMKVREFAREDERRLQLILDPRIGPPTPRTLGMFEAAVEFCACLAWHFYELDAQLEFRCGNAGTPLARASETIYDVLRLLAEVQASPEEPLPLEAEAQENMFRIVCTALPRGSVPTTLWSRSYMIFFDTLESSGTSNAKAAVEVPQ